ncbi:phage protein NinX family protein [Halomonas sp. OfavH-34-E]|uniref:phage protein NinX family protein n=1 Tax=Halomonas sp. OfavH-34-E TaxID=2954491 RepID=UPI002097ABBB|nr:phage protein NinX family protein [Halomonas sp. OfavH-34-E]MCO7218090.1 DUF2591 domain-containing protein [Halomonas sp. OfavH-34-E]
MRVKTSELEGAALDWAVAKTVKAECYFTADIEWWKSPHRFAASSSWMFGGPLIERYKVGLLFAMNGKACSVMAGKGLPVYEATPLIAAMRSIVAAELGDEVDVPEELCSE